MKDFKSFGITPTQQAFIGEKIKIDRILNREIIVHHFKIEDSKFKDKGSGMRVRLQIEVDGEKRLVFSSSTTLMDMIKKVPESEFPFKTTIKKDNERFEFT